MLNYARLLRLSALPTAISNVLAGYLLVAKSWSPVFALAAASAASSFLYLSGMVLNDWFDVSEDRELRPSRPLPAGSISLRRAAELGWTLWGLGLSIVLAVSVWASVVLGKVPWLWLACGVILAAMIVAYNAGLKRTPVGPIAMGSCRALNVLLGAFAADFATRQTASGKSADNSDLWSAIGVAGLVGLFICGVTILSRTEAARPSRISVVGGSLVSLVAFTSLMGAGFKVMLPEARSGSATAVVTLLLGGFVFGNLCTRYSAALAQLSPSSVQKAVGASLMALIPFDGLVCLLARPDAPGYAVSVLSLLVPAMLLRRWIAAT